MSWDKNPELLFQDEPYCGGQSATTGDSLMIPGEIFTWFDNPINNSLFDSPFDDVLFDTQLPAPLVEYDELPAGFIDLPPPLMTTTVVFDEGGGSTSSCPYSGILLPDTQPSSSVMQPNMAHQVMMSSVGSSGENQSAQLPQALPPTARVSELHNNKENGKEINDSQGQSEEVNCVDSASAKLSHSERHNLSEKKRRERINHYRKELRVLTNCPKPDEASILEAAINCVKELLLKLENHSLKVEKMLGPIMSYMQMVIPSFTQRSVTNPQNRAQMANVAASTRQDQSLYSNQMDPSLWNPTAETGNLYNGENFDQVLPGAWDPSADQDRNLYNGHENSNEMQPGAWNVEDEYLYNGEIFDNEFPDFGPLNM